MNLDINALLEDWHYNSPGELVVRKIMGNDGLPKIQMRVDLGLLQMECTARPDGKTPHGKPFCWITIWIPSMNRQWNTARTPMFGSHMMNVKYYKWNLYNTTIVVLVFFN